VAGEPAESRALSGLAPTGGHRIEGTGPGFVPGNYRVDLADAVLQVTDTDAQVMARRLAREEASGAARLGRECLMALQRAAALPPGARIVTTICDSGLKYLAGDLYRD
jgi:cysteine synthase A